jgi:hypothetical protein
VIRVYLHANGTTSQADHVEPAWHAPGGGVLLWVDMLNPSPDEGTRRSRSLPGSTA